MSRACSALSGPRNRPVMAGRRDETEIELRAVEDAEIVLVETDKLD